MKKWPMAIALLAAMEGCASTPKTAPAGASTAPASAVAQGTISGAQAMVPPVGAVTPPPDGCLAMIFYAPGGAQPVTRNAAGRIRGVTTPSGSQEPLLSRSEVDQADAIIKIQAEALRTGELYALAHIPAESSELRMPGMPAWQFLLQYLKDGDQVWSFGDKDLGIAVIRDNNLFCLVLRTHAE